MPIADLDEGLDVLSRSDLFLLPWEGERRTGLRDVLRGKPRSWRSISILIGPEGGFSRTEVERAVCSGARTITLGQRIFRTETAGMIASALVLFELGQLGPTDKAGGVDR
jgi:16S rRNA (uracil1498-N3)-methyltransferase